MDWQALLNPEIQDFMHEHRRDDVHDLALKKSPQKNWPYALIMEQIKAKQKAQKKIPQWLEHNSQTIFLKSALLEQASSSATAKYKAKLVAGKTFVDLCAGVGVDACALADYYETGFLVEKDKETAELLAHNFSLLTKRNIRVINEVAEEVVKTIDPVDLAYIDPQRRDKQRKGKYRLEGCQPNVLNLLPALRQKAKNIMIKCSPMMDIDQGLEALPETQHVHVVQYDGECKELVFVISSNADIIEKSSIPITAVILNDLGNAQKSLTFTRDEEKSSKTEFEEPENMLFEPDPAFLKSGAYRLIAKTYNLKKLHPHTHLYTGGAPNPDFPGRQFEIIKIMPAHQKALSLKQANLAIRNFPGTTNDLKKRLKIKDGGEDYIFACTLIDQRKVLIQTRKIRL